MPKNRPRHVTVLLLLYHREQKDCHGHERKVLWKTFVILRDWTTTSAVAYWRLHQKRKKWWNILYNCTRGQKSCWHHLHSLAETWRDFHKSRESKSMNKCVSVCVFVFHCNKPIKSNVSVSTSCQIIKHTQWSDFFLVWPLIFKILWNIRSPSLGAMNIHRRSQDLQPLFVYRSSRTFDTTMSGDEKGQRVSEII